MIYVMILLCILNVFIFFMFILWFINIKDVGSVVCIRIFLVWYGGEIKIVIEK